MSTCSELKLSKFHSCIAWKWMAWFMTKYWNELNLEPFIRSFVCLWELRAAKFNAADYDFCFHRLISSVHTFRCFAGQCGRRKKPSVLATTSIPVIILNISQSHKLLITATCVVHCSNHLFRKHRLTHAHATMSHTFAGSSSFQIGIPYRIVYPMPKPIWLFVSIVHGAWLLLLMLTRSRDYLELLHFMFHQHHTYIALYRLRTFCNFMED